MLKITESAGKIAIHTPYSPEFARKARLLGARWSPDTRAWIADARATESVRAAMVAVWGADDRPAELVTVHVVLTKEVSERLGPVTLFGRIIASASGRDSGARVGDGVAFTRLAPRSGGSVKNWDTVVPNGSHITIYDVPRRAVEEGLDWNDDLGTLTIEEPESAADQRAALLAERDTILARLAELNALLA